MAWRLCPNCTWMEREGEHDLQSFLPQVQPPLWQDDGQRQDTACGCAQVMANTEDRASRSFDESDDREPKFYDKNMFVLKADEDVTEAWFLDCEEVPFGFEFFRKITLREVNFGEANGGGARIQVAGRERTARSFELCELAAGCGAMARLCIRPGAATARTRRRRRRSACYLYREFTSEAIRMLLPVARPRSSGKSNRSWPRWSSGCGRSSRAIRAT